MQSPLKMNFTFAAQAIEGQNVNPLAEAQDSSRQSNQSKITYWALPVKIEPGLRLRES